MAMEQSKGKAGGPPASADPSLQRGRNFLQEVLTELKKTTWPNKQEATRLTLVVVGTIFLLGLYMGALDYLLSLFVNKFSLIK